MDTNVTYHVCSKQEWFASFEKLDGRWVSFGDERTCHIEGYVSSYQDVQWAGERVARCEICSSIKEKAYLS